MDLLYILGLVSPELYATPIIAGLTLQALLVGLSGLDDSTALLIGAVSTFYFSRAGDSMALAYARHSH